jgi:hypothetical protein
MPVWISSKISRALCLRVRGADECGVRGKDAALALDRLEDHRARALADVPLQRSNVVERQVRDAAGQRLEAAGVLLLPADAHREQRAAVERVGERDDLVLLRSGRGVRMPARELERRLVGLRAGIAEEHPLGECRRAELRREAQRGLVGHHVGQVPELLRLLLQCRHEARMTVTERSHRDATGEVHVLATLLVPETASARPHRDEVRGLVAGDHHLVEGLPRHG